ncbi:MULTISPECIES: DUF2059 domain-containing protein [unclassified Aureimonas]|uniref:DUF2059 domain-containing protein n=1 Tax=unclassified Aureimonas TaxID=2615206 RepID=UPI0009E6FB5C|nr:MULTISPECIES: DUF2059 domain-containing protein [unclassified Aureimonas]
MHPSQTMRSGLIAVAAFAVLAFGSANAQEIGESHLAAARAAVNSIESTDQFDNILLNAATQVKADLIGNNPNLQTQISDMVDDAALALAPRRNDLENEVARVYAKLFTEQELNEIAQFYGSEAGKKLLRQGPLATREMLAAAEVWTNGIVRDLRVASVNGMAALMPEGGVASPTTDPTDPAAAAPVTGAAGAPAGSSSTQ